MTSTSSMRDTGSFMSFGALRFSPEQLRRDFDRRPFLIEHDLCDHPLLQLPRLIELARSLPESSVEFNSGDLPVNQPAHLTPRTGLSIEQTLLQIESARSWMVLKYIEEDPEYAKLLDSCLDPLQPLIEEVRPGMCRRHAFVFVSSPGSVTPYHVDFEHNFLLHLRGVKQMTVWDGENRKFMSEVDRERKLSGDPRNLEYREEFAEHGQRFELRPGMGLQVPLSSPHWVKVGDQVSVSLSVTFLSRNGARLRTLHCFNAGLRKRGFQPREVGSSRAMDNMKFAAARVLDRVQRVTARLRRVPQKDLE
jgi:hypothetical protein